MKKHILLIHGLWESALILRLLSNRLRRKDYTVSCFSYSVFFASAEQVLKRLNEKIESIEGDEIFVVGHSLGGILILSYLERYQDNKISRIVLAGTPVRGSATAQTMINQFHLGFLFGFAREMLLNGQSTKYADKCGVISGTGGVGAGQLFCALPLPHDGTVAVAETSLAGAKASIEIPFSHFSMLFSPKLADAVDSFLRLRSFE